MELRDIKGIGEKTEQLFNKVGVYTSEDLVNYYPRAYDTFAMPVTLVDADMDDIVSIDAVICSNVTLEKVRNLQILSVYIKDVNHDTLRLTWYNMPFLKNKLRIGMRYIFRGRIIYKRGAKVMEQPSIYTLAEYELKLHEMQPVYALTKGLTNNMVSKSVKKVFEVQGMYEDYLPADFREKYNLSEYNFALKNIHFPLSTDNVIKARKRLVFDEFFRFLMAIRKLREVKEVSINEHVICNDTRTDEFIKNLPFELTKAQQKVWEEIKRDMVSDKTMNRLIQGDVGSGKTILAVLALLNCALAGKQSAMMVPTEVLAKQQYDSIVKMFADSGLDIEIVLLTGSTSRKDKKAAYESISSGKAQIIIGTHALIQEKVEYNDLALVITDEQHRFGVNQRNTFGEKGHKPHVLVMSATPIPRTLAIIIYGDLDISIVDELPANRLPIKNCVVDESYMPRAYRFIEDEIRAGHQVYVICPMVEESENIEAKNVIDYSEELRAGLAPGITIEYLHGKMKNEQKNDIMGRFAKNEIKVLVSTTVIEVGVNVPNATVIMIEDAGRFGLAQLHQLRGRVGRGSAQSYCIMVSNSKSKKTKERLNILAKSNDGFYIASEDLKLRGPGDIFGIRQSGLLQFELGDIYTDAEILKDAKETCDIIYNNDPELQNIKNQGIKNILDKYLEKGFEKLCL